MTQTSNDDPYLNHELLAETDWLSMHLDDEDIRIVDLRHREEYDKGHIKNSVHLNYADITGHDTEKRTLPPRNSAVILGSLGIDRNTMVVAYDDDSGHYAARLFWILEYLDHQKTRVLNGGSSKWIKEKRGLTTNAHRINVSTFLPQPHPDRIATSEWILKHISNPALRLLGYPKLRVYNGSWAEWGNDTELPIET